MFTNRRKKTPYEANRILALLNMAFNLAEKWGMRENHSNPCAHVKKFPEKKRERVLTSDEISRLGDVLRHAETETLVTSKGRKVKINPYAVWAIRLLFLTGARKNEILELEWRFVNWDRARLQLPDSKTGEKEIYLNEPALETLAAIPKVDGNPYVIIGGKPQSHLVNIKDSWDVIRLNAGLSDLRLHDLRHNFATYGASGGATLGIIGKLLGHKEVSTTARYAHFQDDPLRQENEKIGQELSRALERESPTAKVVNLPINKK